MVVRDRPGMLARYVIRRVEVRIIAATDRRGREVIMPVASNVATLIEGIDAVVEELGSFAYIPAYWVGYTYTVAGRRLIQDVASVNLAHASGVEIFIVSLVLASIP